jgi:REP element-mobilizing transposase RayT
MSRTRRVEYPGAIHHAVPAGIDRCAIARDDRDRRLLVERLAHVAETFEWELLAYCVMTTHAHVVVRTTTPSLGAGMQQLLGWYARRFNLRHHREHSLFVKGFYSRLVLTGRHLLHACLYTVLNPVAAGLCVHPSGWPFCSYRATAGLGHTGVVRPALVHDVAGGADGFASLVDEGAARIRQARDAHLLSRLAGELACRAAADEPIAGAAAHERTASD